MHDQTVSAQECCTVGPVDAALRDFMQGATSGIRCWRQMACVHLHAPTAQSTVQKTAYRSIITDTSLHRICGQDATGRQTCPMKEGVVVVLNWTLVGYSCPSTTGALMAFLRQHWAG